MAKTAWITRYANLEIFNKLRGLFASLFARLKAIVIRAGMPIWRCLPFTSSSLINERSEQSHVDALVTLFVFVVVQFSAGIFFEQNKGIREAHIAAYAMLGLVTIIAMSLITGNVISNSKNDGGVMFSSSKGTVYLGKWLIFWSAVLCVTFTCLGFAGLLPGQEQYALRVVTAENFDEFVDEIPGIRLDVPLRPAHFGGKIPPEFTLLVSLNKNLLPNWNVRQAQCLEVKNEWGRKTLRDPEVVEGTHPTEIIVQGLYPDSDHIIEIYLSPVGEIAKSKDKALDSRQSAISEILTRGGIELEWEY
jgi:hypothetical protein